MCFTVRNLKVDVLSFKVSDNVVFTTSSSSLSPWAIRAVDAMVSWRDCWSSQDTLSGTSVSPKSNKEALSALLVLAGLILNVPLKKWQLAWRFHIVLSKSSCRHPQHPRSPKMLSWNPSPTLHWSWVETHLVLRTPLTRIWRVGSVTWNPLTRCGS